MINDPSKPLIDVRTTTIPTPDDKPQAYQGTKATAPEKSVTVSGTQTPAAGGTSTTPKDATTATTGTSSSPKWTSEMQGPQQYKAPEVAEYKALSELPKRGIPAEYKVSSYKELIPLLQARMEENKPMTKEELEKLRRRQKAQQIAAGIGDAVRAVPNLVFATKGAPNMYNPTTGMSARMKERFEREQAERDARDERYYNLAYNIAKLRDAEKEQGLQAWKMEHSLEREQVEDKFREKAEERAQKKADMSAELAQLELDLMEGKITEQEAKAEATKIKAQYAGQTAQSVINRNNRAGTGRRGGGGSGAGRKGSDDNTETVTTTTKETKDKWGNPKKTTTTTVKAKRPKGSNSNGGGWAAGLKL